MKGHYRGPRTIGGYVHDSKGRPRMLSSVLPENAKTSGIGWGRFFSKVGRIGHSDLPQLILAALVLPNPRRILQGSLPMVLG